MKAAPQIPAQPQIVDLLDQIKNLAGQQSIESRAMPTKLPTLANDEKEDPAANDVKKDSEEPSQEVKEFDQFVFVFLQNMIK